MSCEKKTLSKKLILEALKKYRGLFNKAPNDQALELYAEMLAGRFEFKQVTWALSEFIKKGSPFFPSCGELFGVLTPKEINPEDRAAEIASEIISKAQLHGYMQVQRAFNELSNEAQQAIGTPSALLDVCNTPYDQMGTLKAQLRRLAKAAMERKAHDQHNQAIAALGVPGKILSISEKQASMKKLDFSDFGQGPA